MSHRLWGIHGQDRIDNANVCLLNASTVGCEVLKNIVLPGFGNFTVVDNKLVTERDLGLNFFVTQSSIGELRSKIVTENLVELNPENVQGNFLAEVSEPNACSLRLHPNPPTPNLTHANLQPSFFQDPATVIEKSPNFFDSFNYIIASQMDTNTLRKLAKICWEKNIVLLVVRSYGLVGYIRIALQHHEVFESKLDTEQDDMRITQPWAELNEFINEQDLDKMEYSDFKHTPYVVFLIKALDSWRSSHDNRLPSTRSEKDEFTKQVQNMARNYADDENVQEAIKKVYQAWTVPEIPHEVQQIFDHPMCSDEGLSNPQTNEFWFMARSLKEFVHHDGHGTLPLQGRVPDMFSDTDRYVKLQTIYRHKAREDMEIAKKHLRALLEKYSRDPDSISDADFKEFCKNALYARTFHYRSIEQELDVATAQKEEIQNRMYDPTDNTIFYLLLRAADSFYAQQGYYPGEKRPTSADAMRDVDVEDGESATASDESLLSAEQYENDSKELKKHLDNLMKELDITDHGFESLEDYCKEITRWGNNELHNISALVGGVGAQELIKLCTKQRLPLNNSWIFNGINSTSSSFEA